MSIDRGDSHYGDAGTWERACRHIGLFLWWAAERRLASEDHDAKKAGQDPTLTFISQCDTKRWNEHLTKEGNAFAEARYDAYLAEVEAYTESLGIHAYEIPDSGGRRLRSSLGRSSSFSSRPSFAGTAPASAASGAAGPIDHRTAIGHGSTIGQGQPLRWPTGWTCPRSAGVPAVPDSPPSENSPPVIPRPR
jgi:hypothetical protein